MQIFRVPGVYIFQFNAPLYFANVGVFRSKLNIETGTNPEELGPTMAQGCIQHGCTRVRVGRALFPYSWKYSRDA